MSYVITPLVTSAHAENSTKEKAYLFKNAVVLNFLISVILFLILFITSPLLHHMQQPEDVVKLAVPFFNVLIFSIIPVSLFFVCKQYCEGLGNTKAAMYISVIGNLLNIVLNYCLIYGKLGMPELGYMGSCWATFFARVFMGFGFIVFVFKNKYVNDFKKYFFEVTINKKHLWLLFKDGVASALQFTFEVAAFAIAGIMAGVLGKEQLDAHGIALSLAAFTYMFASGISGATTITVGTYFADKDFVNSKHAIKTSYKLVVIIMCSMALVFVFCNQVLPMIFSNDAEIIFIASQLLLYAALFQLFDGIQVVAIGALRALQDYKFPTYIAFIGYWIIGLPCCYLFAFVLKQGVIGIWLGLSVSLFFVAIVLFFRTQILLNKNIAIM